MDKDDKNCLSPLKLFERLVQLETNFKVCKEKDAEALVLSRELMQKDKELATVSLDKRLESMNEFRHQMEKQEGCFARKDDTEKEFNALRKLVYVGLGIVLAAATLMKYIH